MSRGHFRLSQTVEFNEKFNEKKFISPTGNRTPVSRVTGGDTYHYTIEDNWLRAHFTEVLFCFAMCVA